MNISASMIKELRERTSAGLNDCKKALTETNGDMEKAADYLREKGLAAAAKRLEELRVKASWRRISTEAEESAFWWK